MKCPNCKIEMKVVKDEFGDYEIDCELHRCPKCRQEFMDMKQLGRLAKKQKNLMRSQEIVFSKWGNSIAVRIPKYFIREFKIKSGRHGILMKDRKGMKIIPD